FFSSRRRHTISKRDWSSDVCSSDLLQRSDVNLREILTKSFPGIQLESYVVFVHQEFTLFTEKNSTILLASQIQSFIRTLNKIPRSEERRVGKECKSRWDTTHEKNKT